MKSLISFFQNNTLESLVEYLKQVKNRDVALEGGKKNSFTLHTLEEDEQVDNLVKNALHRYWSIGIGLLGTLLVQVSDPAVYTGSTVELTFPVDNTRFKHMYLSFYISIQYLFDMNHSTGEINGLFGLKAPLFRQGINNRTDLSVFIKIGCGSSLIKSIDLPGNPFIMDLSLLFSFDIMQRLRISLYGIYQYLYTEEKAVSRWGGGLELSYLP